jgi:hypothetical protein
VKRFHAAIDRAAFATPDAIAEERPSHRSTTVPDPATMIEFAKIGSRQIGVGGRRVLSFAETTAPSPRLHIQPTRINESAARLNILRSHSWAASVAFRFMPQNADVYVRGFVRQFVH